MLAPGDPAPDFRIGDRSLHQTLENGEMVVSFYPKALGIG